MEDWAEANKAGREAAAKAIEEARETEDLPALVARIREAARAEDGQSVGFLYRVAGAALG